MHIEIRSLLGAVALAALFAGPSTAEPIAAARFLKERGATKAELGQVARSPAPTVTPVAFFDKDAMAPSCGLLIAKPGSPTPRFIELVGSEPDAGFPQCLAIPSMTLFTLQGRKVLMIESLRRETREDVYREFHYLHEEPGQGFVVDKVLDAAAPGKESSIADATPTAARTLEGIKLARAAVVKQTYPQWRFHDRDFIADNASSFAVFDDSTARECHIAVEAGAQPVTVGLADVVPGSRCAGVLASSRLKTPAATYYLGLFKSDGAKQLTAIVSVTTAGAITNERDLSAILNRAGATGDIKAAKAALAAHLRLPHDMQTR